MSEKNEEETTLCAHCGTEFPVDESQQCETCAVDPLCENCIGEFDHNCQGE